MKKRLFAFLIFTLPVLVVLSQNNIGIGTTIPNAKAILDISSTNKGVLMPRLTQSQINGIANPPQGLMVYNTEDNCIHIYNGTSWTKQCGLTPTTGQSASLPAGTWSRQRNMPQRNNASICAGFGIGQRLYLATLSINPNQNEFWEYDVDMNSWTRKADFPGGGRFGAVALAIGSKGYLGMGFGSSGYTNDWWEYDPGSNGWIQRIQYPGTSRQYATGFTIGTKGYVCSGRDQTGNNTTNELYEYDPVFNTWTPKASMPGSGIFGAVAAVANNGRAYVGTGSYGGSWFEYNAATNSWATKAGFPGTGRAFASAFAFGDDLYVGLGQGGAYKDFWKYNTLDNSWVQIGDFEGAARYGAVGYSVAGGGVILSGADGFSNPLADAWQQLLIPGSGTLWQTVGFPSNSGVEAAGWVKAGAQMYTIIAGNVGIGNNQPTAKLHLEGSFRLVDGTQGNGKILTSDANGLANWASPVVAPAYWTANGNNIYNTNTGNVGIGTSNPQPYGHGGNNKFIEIRNTQTGANSQSHVILTSAGSSGSLGTITWANTGITSGTEQRTGLIANVVEGGTSANPNTGLGIYTRNPVTGLVERVRISTDGNMGIGTTDPVFKLDVGARMRLRATPGLSAGLWLNNQANTASPAFVGMRSDTEVGFYGQTGSADWRFYVNTTTGNAFLQGGLTQNSDATLKKNIVPINNAADLLAQLHGYRYQWMDENADAEMQLGLLAQEVQKVLPELVKEAENGKLGVNYSGLIPVLLEALKEQQIEIDALKQAFEKLTLLVKQANVPKPINH